MKYWSLSNILFPVRYRQFVDMTTQFKKAAEQAFGTQCQLSIRLLRAPKMYSSFRDKNIQRANDEINKRNTILETADLGAVTRDWWGRARYVDVRVTPIDKEKAPEYAWGNMQFKGMCPRQVAYYISSDTDDIVRTIRLQNWWMWPGDGSKKNGIRNMSVPSSVLRTFGEDEVKRVMAPGSPRVGELPPFPPFLGL